ncbi:MAG: arylesterase [Polynucleobacter victoriensis]
MANKVNILLKMTRWIQSRHMVLVFALLCMAVSYAPNSSASNPKILILGDSLSAEYGLPRGTGWVSLLDKRLVSNQLSWSLINASISGETSAGGQTRLATLLKTHQPQIVIVELGANDALRGLQLQATEKNLRQIIQSSKNAGARVLLLGMRIPPNYGPDYSNQFFGLFAKLANSERIEYLPFFLEKVADKSELFQADRIHPNAQAQSILLDNVWPKLKPMLNR